VEHHTWDVEPSECHDRGRIDLVAADNAVETVEKMTSGDDLIESAIPRARRARRIFFRAHRDTVRNRDRVELNRRSSAIVDAALDVLRKSR
jgi:hypothetical protein